MAESQEERTERLRKMLNNPKPEWFNPRPGYASSARADGSAGLVSEKSLRDQQSQKYVSEDVRWDLPKIQKRTERQRAESYANRIWKAVQDREPLMLEAVLHEIHGDKWKHGDPISYDDVKKWAIEILKKAAEDMKAREGH